jgi:hypothetical protein
MLEGFHLKVLQILLTALEPYGFALGGGYALQAHGVIDRPSTDIDGYTDNPDVVIFNAAEVAVAKAFEAESIQCFTIYSDSWFRALRVVDLQSEESVTIDLGYDYRENKPILIAGIGAVLDIDDVITGKVRAFWDRQAARDYIDIDAILATGKWSVNYLYTKLQRVRPEASAIDFAAMLKSVIEFADEYAAYGLSDGDVISLSTRLESAADELLAH